MTTVRSDRYILVADTNLYSGNFEREMVAYATGQVGECGVGEEEAASFAKFVSDTGSAGLSGEFEAMCLQVDDGEGCRRPAAIWPTPGRGNDGKGQHYDLPEDAGTGHYPAYESVAAFFSARPTPEMIEVFQKRVLAYGAIHRIVIKGFRLLCEKTVTSVERLSETLVSPAA